MKNMFTLIIGIINMIFGAFSIMDGDIGFGALLLSISLLCFTAVDFEDEED